MSKLNIREIFKDSLSSIDKMLNRLDTQLGTNSNANLIPITSTVNPISTPQKINIEENNTNTQEPVKTETKKVEIPEQKKEPKKNKEEKKPKKVVDAPVLSEEEKKIAENIKLFGECDLRVGKIIELSYMENSDKVYLLKIDVGEAEIREIGTGLRKFVKEEDLLNKKCVVFANLKPKKLGSK